MATKGEKLRTRVTAIINKANLRSTITINGYTRTVGSKGGYEAGTFVLASTTSVYAIPSSYTKMDVLLQNLGDIKAGALRMLVPYDTTIELTSTTKYEVVMNSQTFLVDKVEDIFFNDVVIARTIDMSKELD